MKAMLVGEKQELLWSDVPYPVCKDDEVIIKIHYAAVNRADLMQREGTYPPPPGCPEWMGLEVSGEIVELGAEAKASGKVKLGDMVCALLGGGGYAEYVAVPYGMTMPIPEGCSLEEAAAMPEAFATAYLNLFHEGKIQSGNTLLMHAGASGLASVVIPMAKAFGVRVITTVLSEEKAKEIAHLKADIVVDSSKTDIVDVLKAELEAGRPVDVAIDCLGGANMAKCLPYVQRWGRWIMIATLAGDLTELDMRNLYVRNIRLIGSTLRARTPEFKAEILSSLVKDIWPKVTSGEVRATIYKVLPMAEAEKAHDLLQSGTSAGKVVLKVI
ncbi:MAG: NAD(P)H-quinone oxidoreductase [Clostridia bacterium]|nr:NAD(P)H-quinone oxidoreductase [Clostridia bacterium]